MNNIIIRKCKGISSTSALVFLFCMLISLYFSECIAQQFIHVNAAKQGILADDKIPDSESIQELFDHSKPGTELFFPKGVYYIDQPVNITISKLIIKGEDGTIFWFTNTTDYYKKYGTRVGIFNVMADNITFDHIYINQNFTGSGRKDGDDALIGGILMGGSYHGKPVNTNNITVKNCTVYDYYGDAVSVFHSSVNNYTVTNNTFISSYIVGNWTYAEDKGEQAVNAASGNNITITNNTIRGALDDAIAVHNFCSNVVIANNDITTTGGRITINGTNKGLVSGNTITYIQDGGTGIWVSFEFEAEKFTLNNNVTITKNKVFIPHGIKAVSGIWLFGPGDNITVSDNIFETEDKQGTGIIIKDRLNKKVNKKFFGNNIIIKNNKIKNFKVGINKTISKKVAPPTIDYIDNYIINADTAIINKQ